MDGVANRITHGKVALEAESGSCGLEAPCPEGLHQSSGWHVGVAFQRGGQLDEVELLSAEDGVNRATRDKFASATQADLTTGNACWETAPALYEALNDEFGPFDIDLTADSDRHLCDLWFGPGSPVGEYDALSAVWAAHGLRGYSNPPYDRRFVPKILARARYMQELGFESLFLLPLRVTKAFHEHVLKAASDLYFLDKRLVFFENGVPRCSFDKSGNVRPDTALFDSILVRYRLDNDYDNRPEVHTWHVPKHVFPADIERWMEKQE